jgi:hypothetical protein
MCIRKRNQVSRSSCGGKIYAVQLRGSEIPVDSKCARLAGAMAEQEAHHPELCLSCGRGREHMDPGWGRADGKRFYLAAKVDRAYLRAESCRAASIW